MNRFICVGELEDKLDIRNVGENGLWQVQDFVLSYRYGTRHDQKRIFQAVKGAIGQLEKLKVGAMVAVTFLAKGRMTEKGKFFNLDECVDVSELVGSEFEFYEGNN